MLGKGVASDTLKLDLKGTVPAKRARAWRGTYGAPWDVTAMRVTFAPGAHSGWHRHPGPGIVVVTRGAVTFYSDDCTPKTYTEGQSFIEIPGVTNMVRNDTQGTAQFVATFVNPATAPLRIDVPSAPCSA
jgi:quercetin dioxygenase-like cupin family protein